MNGILVLVNQDCMEKIITSWSSISCKSSEKRCASYLFVIICQPYECVWAKYWERILAYYLPARQYPFCLCVILEEVVFACSRPPVIVVQANKKGHSSKCRLTKRPFLKRYSFIARYVGHLLLRIKPKSKSAKNNKKNVGGVSDGLLWKRSRMQNSLGFRRLE